MGVTLNCINCGTEFEGKRKTAKFCSAKCRVRYNRNGAMGIVEQVEIQQIKRVVAKSTPREIVELINSKKDYEFCQHNAVKGFCKKGCK